MLANYLASLSLSFALSLNHDHAFMVNSDSSIRLTNIDQVARVAWEEDNLEDAEEILSRQVIRGTGPDHTAFANRALIRARLHHWNAALRDAETVSFVSFLHDA